MTQKRAPGLQNHFFGIFLGLKNTYIEFGSLTFSFSSFLEGELHTVRMSPLFFSLGAFSPRTHRKSFGCLPKHLPLKKNSVATPTPQGLIKSHALFSDPIFFIKNAKCFFLGSKLKTCNILSFFDGVWINLLSHFDQKNPTK